MSTISWPSSVSYSEPVEDWFAELADAVMYGRGESDLPDEAPSFVEHASGEGRVVYDISQYTNIPAVLRVAHTQYGVDETDAEVVGRGRVSSPLRERLVSVLDHGHGCHWSVQPKCRSLGVGSSETAVSELCDLAEQAGYDSREVYARNVGQWDSTPVLFDFGGLF